VARCRRTWRLPAPGSASASSPGVSAPLVSPRPDRLQVATHRRRRDAGPPPAPLALLPLPPSSLLSAVPRFGKGKTPRQLGWREMGSAPGDVDARSRRCEGKDAPALQDWLLSRVRRHGRPSVAAIAPVASPTGALGSFPQQISPLGWATGACAGLACVPARRPSRLLPRARAAAVRCGGRG
jgi:hypothetical protein